VNTRVKAWIKHRSSATRNQSSIIAQLEWEAEVVEYVGFVYKLTKTHGNSKKATLPPCLPKDVPLLGPWFLPSLYLHIQKRQSMPIINPEISYLKPLNIVHPFYYDSLGSCPRCQSTDILWDGWTTTGHRKLHGIHEEETALGYQLICKQCKSQYLHEKGGAGDGEGAYCFATTNPVFWKLCEHWAIPSMVKYIS
jgi:hypothetical protein